MRLDESPSRMRVKKRRGLMPEPRGSPVLGGLKEHWRRMREVASEVGGP